LQEDLTAKRVLIERQRATLATRSQLSDSIRLLASTAPLVLTNVLPADEAQTAVRDLVARTTVIITRHETRLERVQPNRDSLMVAQLGRVSGRAVFGADTRGMTDVLADLTRDAAIHVDSLEVENVPRWGSAEDSVEDPAAPERLRITVHIHAWFVVDSSLSTLPKPAWDGGHSDAEGARG
jgi:hypothetical protein